MGQLIPQRTRPFDDDSGPRFSWAKSSDYRDCSSGELRCPIVRAGSLDWVGRGGYVSTVGTTQHKEGDRLGAFAGGRSHQGCLHQRFDSRRHGIQVRIEPASARDAAPPRSRIAKGYQTASIVPISCQAKRIRRAQRTWLERESRNGTVPQQESKATRAPLENPTDTSIAWC